MYIFPCLDIDLSLHFHKLPQPMATMPQRFFFGLQGKGQHQRGAHHRNSLPRCRLG